jgi:hypothetical protein
MEYIYMVYLARSTAIVSVYVRTKAKFTALINIFIIDTIIIIIIIIIAIIST